MSLDQKGAITELTEALCVWVSLQAIPEDIVQEASPGSRGEADHYCE